MKHKMLFTQVLWTAGVAAGIAMAQPAAKPMAANSIAAPPASQPTPAMVSRAWTLNFKFQDPQRLSVVEPGQAKPVVYWYMLYTVENTTDREVQFYPEFELVTDTLRVVQSGRDVSPAAYQAVVDRANNPALLPPEKILGRLLVGKDRAKHGVAIWKDFDPQAKGFTVYVGGLSGEQTRWKNPAFNAEKPEGPSNQKYFMLRKTLAIPYEFASSEANRSMAVPRRQVEKQTWVMR